MLPFRHPPYTLFFALLPAIIGTGEFRTPVMRAAAGEYEPQMRSGHSDAAEPRARSPQHHVSEPRTVERTAFLMGTTLRARVTADTRAGGFAAVEAAFDEVRRIEAILSTWTATSEIARVNSAREGTAVPVSPELLALLLEAAEWTSRTGGAFDPAVGALVDAWDLRGAGRVPAPDELAAARRATGISQYQLSQSDAGVRVPGRGWMDTGAFGKGAALRAAERVLIEHGVQGALLDFGGQLLAYGAPPAEDNALVTSEAPAQSGTRAPASEGARELGWQITVAHPAIRDMPVVTVRLPGGHSAATSAQSERFIEVDGRRYGHILDPRTGRPIAPWGSVTVVAKDAFVADVLSTAVLVMGLEEGRRWAAERPEGVLFLDARGKEVVVSWNAAFEQFRAEESTITSP